MSNGDLIIFATGLFSLNNPLHLLPTFVGMVNRFPEVTQRKIARMTSLALIFIYLISVWVGQLLLETLGISVPSLQAAGGLLLLKTGLSMVKAEEHALTGAETEEVHAKSDWRSLAIVPLAIPFTAGGGTIALIIATATQFDDFTSLTSISLVCLGMAFIIWLSYRNAGYIGKKLGTTSMNVVTRIMGIVLLALGFRFLALGLGGLLPGLTGS